MVNFIKIKKDAITTEIHKLKSNSPALITSSNYDFSDKTDLSISNPEAA
jgi:hypothetical protein